MSSNNNNNNNADDDSHLEKRNNNNEEDLRQQLRQAMQRLSRREPLDPTYKRLLMNGIVTPRRPVLLKSSSKASDGFKEINSHLRERVEVFVKQNEGKDPLDRLTTRQPIQEAALRAAVTLRESKDHEQQALLEATLAALPRRQGMDEVTRKRHWDAVALGLQSRTAAAHAHHSTTQAKKQQQKQKHKKPKLSAAEQTEQARQQAELERQREQARKREAARLQRQEEERRQRISLANKEGSNNSAGAGAVVVVETPQQALHKLYYPIFQKLWDMEFKHLGSTNPFRMVIDRDNCASVGAPDYFAVVSEPMNLTFIQRKVHAMNYDSLAAFMADVDLMISNALLYNSDPTNPYHIAAQELKKRYMKMVKKVLQTIQSKQQQQQQK